MKRIGRFESMLSDQSNAGIVAQRGVVVSGRAQGLRTLVEIHGANQVVVRRFLGPAAAMQGGVRPPLAEDARVIAPLVLSGQPGDLRSSLSLDVRSAVGDPVRVSQDQADARGFMVGGDGENVETDALGQEGFVQEPIPFRLFKGSRDRFVGYLFELEHERWYQIAAR